MTYVGPIGHLVPMAERELVERQAWARLWADVLGDVRDRVAEVTAELHAAAVELRDEYMPETFSIAASLLDQLDPRMAGIDTAGCLVVAGTWHYRPLRFEQDGRTVTCTRVICTARVTADRVKIQA